MTRLSTVALSLAVLGLASLASVAIAAPGSASDRTAELDTQHKDCLERIAQDQALALEEAMIWRDQGGGRRARHCEAMALFALGHEGEAAHRLDQLADSRDGGSPLMRANFRSEAANFWLAAAEPERALTSATAGLVYEENPVPLLIARARAHAMGGDLDAADEELARVLRDAPNNAEALRYRADLRLRQNRLVAAKGDIEASLLADPTSVETALLRGRINEAIRLVEVE